VHNEGESSKGVRYGGATSEKFSLSDGPRKPSGSQTWKAVRAPKKKGEDTKKQRKAALTRATHEGSSGDNRKPGTGEMVVRAAEDRERELRDVAAKRAKLRSFRA